MQQSKVKTPQGSYTCSFFSSDNHFKFQTKDKIFRSLIDYIFVPEWITPKVKYKKIFQDFAFHVSDHVPLLCRIDIKISSLSYNQTIQEIFQNGS